MELDQKQVQAAWAALGVAQERWLVSDPLRLVGTELSMDISSYALDGLDPTVEVDVVTRPKQSGGVRTELFPGLTASVFLQAAADLVAENLTQPTDSLSIRLFGVRLQAENPYDAWSSAVASWLRSELDAGHAVLICDVQDYFASIRREQLARALSGHMVQPLCDRTLRVLDAIHEDCRRQGLATTGLPVSPADFFWLLADLVLLPLDSEIRRIAGVSAYARWVDDLFVSTTSARHDTLIEDVEAAVRHFGFDLNRLKTRVLNSPEEFRSHFRVPQHDLLSHLFSTAEHGIRTPRIESIIQELHGSLMGTGVEDSRLMKRLYGLATLIGSPILVDCAAIDLERVPTAEAAILSYLGGQAWPPGTELTAVAAIEHGSTDSRVILALRSLLNSPSSSALIPRLVDRVGKLALNDDIRIHPYARAVMAAFLAKHSTLDTFAEFTAEFLPRVASWHSPMGRRLAYEFLSLDSQAHHWLPGLEADSSAYVRTLGRIFMGGATERERAMVEMLAGQRRPRRMAWGDMEARLAPSVLAYPSAKERSG